MGRWRPPESAAADFACRAPRWSRLCGDRGGSESARLCDRDPAPLRQEQVPEDIATAAIAGEAVLCIGASEAGGGSDLQNVKSTAVAEDGGYRLRGHKKYVSLSPIADIALIVVRGVATDGPARHGDVGVVRRTHRAALDRRRVHQSGSQLPGHRPAQLRHLGAARGHDRPPRDGSGRHQLGPRSRAPVCGGPSGRGLRPGHRGDGGKDEATRTIRRTPVRPSSPASAHRRLARASRRTPMGTARHRQRRITTQPPHIRSDEGHGRPTWRRGDLRMHAHFRRHRLSAPTNRHSDAGGGI